MRFMRRLNDNRGISLIMALLVIATLSVLGEAFTLSSINQSRVSQKYSSSTQAFWLADAGVQKAVWELNHNSCAGFVQCGTATACASCTNCGSGNKCLAGTLSTNGDYDVTLDNSNTLVTSIGSYPSRSSSKKITRKVLLTVASNSMFNYAAFAQGNMTLSNNVTVDSYDSSKGAYGVSNKGSQGNIGSNGTVPASINLSNNVTVKGNASTGSGGTVLESNGASVTGTTTNTNNVTLTAVTVPSELSSLSSGGTLSVGNNGSATVPAGDYKYSAISLSNNSTLTISGAVRLYLTGVSALSTGNNVTINISTNSSLALYTDGVVSVSNNAYLNNTTQIPANFIVYSTYTGANGVTMSNNGSFYGAVYAPTTDVTVSNNGATYGAMVGKTISVSNNGIIHYDQALRSVGGGGTFSTSGWHEQ